VDELLDDNLMRGTVAALGRIVVPVEVLSKRVFASIGFPEKPMVDYPAEVVSSPRLVGEDCIQ